MAGFRVAALLLALFATLAHAVHAANFSYLVRQWGPGYCKTTSCSKTPPNTRFTIHGLWPNYGAGGYPQNCGGALYSSTASSSLNTRLSTQWPSFKGTDASFWSYEYNKHGTCAVNSGVFADQYDYFSSTLSLDSSYNLLTALRAAGITPSNTVRYTDTAITNYFGKDTLIKCVSGYLTEIWQCHDDFLNLVNCNTACYGSSCQNTDCSQNILIPAS